MLYVRYLDSRVRADIPCHACERLQKWGLYRCQAVQSATGRSALSNHVTTVSENAQSRMAVSKPFRLGKKKRKNGPAAFFSSAAVYTALIVYPLYLVYVQTSKHKKTIFEENSLRVTDNYCVGSSGELRLLWSFLSSGPAPRYRYLATVYAS